jgi:hypothetical protein
MSYPGGANVCAVNVAVHVAWQLPDVSLSDVVESSC